MCIRWKAYESDRWKHGIAEKICRLEGVTSELMSRLAESASATPSRDDEIEIIQNAGADNQQQESWEVDPKCEPASIPASCISEMSNPGPHEAVGPPRGEDIISRGIITRHEADSLFQLPLHGSGFQCNCLNLVDIKEAEFDFGKSQHISASSVIC
jgi:hypothetical protein